MSASNSTYAGGSWWSRTRLRTRIFLAFSALVVAVLAATLGLTQWEVTRDAQRTVQRELATTGEVFQGLLDERLTRLESNSILLASDFALKRVLSTHLDPESYDGATLASAALSYRDRIGVDLLWMTDETGSLLVTSEGPDPARYSLAALAPLKDALETGEATAAIGVLDDDLMQLVAVPVFAPDIIGFLLLGQAIDDALARRLKQETGTHVSFLAGDTIYASSWPSDQRAIYLPPHGRLAQILDRSADGAVLLATRNGRYLSLPEPVEATLAEPLFALMQASYDDALRPLHALQARIVVIGLGALVAALLIGVGLAGGITAPVQNLVAGMREVLKGNLRYRSRIERDDEIGFLARSFNEMVGGLEERERIRDTFGRFVSHDVAEAVLNGAAPLGSVEREVSILFQDIRGFTALSERLDPATLLDVLNQFFTEVVAAVEAEGGVVKQFLGDGAMALFGAPQAVPDHAQRAVRAALGVVQRLGVLNERLRERGLSPLEIGIGVHSGKVVAGLIGPDSRSEYGVVGDAVNLASRIEALTKEVGATILVSREIALQLSLEFHLGRAATLAVKGKREPVEVVEVLPYKKRLAVGG